MVLPSFQTFEGLSLVLGLLQFFKSCYYLRAGTIEESRVALSELSILVLQIGHLW